MADDRSVAAGQGVRVAVVVPIRDRLDLTPDEELSLRHLDHHLGRYDRYVVAPEGLRVTLPGFRVKRFPGRFFGSARAHNDLMFSRGFYEAFADYEHILIHHLDALVLSDQLEEWCRTEWDCIGAPWWRTADDPGQGFEGVGNGGFTLRRVAAFLRAFDSPRYREDPRAYWRRNFSRKPVVVRLANLPRRYLKYARPFNGIRRHMRQFKGNEDRFWFHRAAWYHPEFRFPPPEVALRFAFEAMPRECYAANGFRLPFGCHAWARYDRAFWEPFLLQPQATTD